MTGIGGFTLPTRPEPPAAPQAAPVDDHTVTDSVSLGSDRNWFQRNLSDPVFTAAGRLVRLESALGGVVENATGNALGAGLARLGFPEAGQSVAEAFGSEADRTRQNGLDFQRWAGGAPKPNANGRQGAFDATLGHPPGTVGHAVNNAIGTIQAVLGDFGEERIGTVFNSPEARALYDQPVAGPASDTIAQTEYAYWSSLRQRNPSSSGGFMGSLFGPGVRSWMQRNLFSAADVAVTSVTGGAGQVSLPRQPTGARIEV